LCTEISVDGVSVALLSGGDVNQNTNYKIYEPETVICIVLYSDIYIYIYICLMYSTILSIWYDIIYL